MHSNALARYNVAYIEAWEATKRNSTATHPLTMKGRCSTLLTSQGHQQYVQISDLLPSSAKRARLRTSATLTS